MKIGTTSFGFRYAFLDPANSPTFAEMIRQARATGVERLQICENTRPLEVSKREWQEALRCAADLGRRCRHDDKLEFRHQPPRTERHADASAELDRVAQCRVELLVRDVAEARVVTVDVRPDVAADLDGLCRRDVRRRRREQDCEPGPCHAPASIAITASRHHRRAAP